MDVSLLLVATSVVSIGAGVVIGITYQKDKTPKIAVPEAIEVFTTALKNDPDYFMGWQANIAMSYVDAEANYKSVNKRGLLNKHEKHIVANEAAKSFLNMLINISK